MKYKNKDIILQTSEDQQSKLALPTMSLPLRVLFSGYIIVTGIGLMMAGFQILLTHGMADGQFGLSVNDIVYSYYGNRENSRLEEKLNGTMKDMASTHDRAEIIKWVRNGASEESWNTHIHAVFEKNCTRCHGNVPGLTELTSFEKVKPLANISEGASINALARVSHVHLFGIAFISFFICVIFSFSVGLSDKLKAIAIATPFAFLLVDIMSWWATKWYPSFAYVEIMGGICYNLAVGFMILTSLYQMWVMPRKKAS